MQYSQISGNSFIVHINCALHAFALNVTHPVVNFNKLVICYISVLVRFNQLGMVFEYQM